ncbi:MAG: hypothetical protein HGA27_03760, partial [Peptococcaceae bacterium]|nr:hypothetical protein [Peptococcaceae bacterium]
MAKIFLIVGVELHQNIVDLLKVNNFELVGFEYTLDAALVRLKGKKSKADVLVVNGLAQASGISEGEINRNQSLLLKLRALRMSEPNIRILLLLPGQNSSELILNIISLGIYDIHQISKFSGGELLEWIKNPMTIADYRDFRPAKVRDFPLGGIKFDFDSKDISFKKSLDNPTKKIKAIIPDDLTGIEEEKRSEEIKRQRKKLLALIFASDPKVEGWIKRRFSDHLDLLILNEFDDIKAIILDIRPDIFIILGCNNPLSDLATEEITIWAVDKVRNLIFIMGQLDEIGRVTKERIASAGVSYIISCEQGGYISGDELIYIINKIIKETN